jgi:hypothetical protein
MLSTSDIAAISVLTIGVGAFDIARIVQQQPVMPEPAQLWIPAPRQPVPDQQRQQAEDWRLDRLERRLDADRRLPQPGALMVPRTGSTTLTVRYWLRRSAMWAR